MKNKISRIAIGNNAIMGQSVQKVNGVPLSSTFGTKTKKFSCAVSRYKVRTFAQIAGKPPPRKGGVRKTGIKAEVILTAGEEAKSVKGAKALAARNREREHNKLRMRRVREAQRAAGEPKKIPFPAV